MDKIHDQLNEKLIEFIKQQKIFFVASAPLAADGLINLSPKGYDSIVVLDPITIAWIDLGGSGIETLAHTKENGRMTLMFCAFEGSANILRLHGKAQVSQFDDPDFAKLMALFPAHGRARNIFTLSIERIAESCGWGVPFFEFTSEREQLKRYVDNPALSTDKWVEKRQRTNAVSLDGLPGIVTHSKSEKP